MEGYMRSGHIGIHRVKYACDQCDYEASCKSNVKIHIQSKHEGIQSISEGARNACGQCGLQFTHPTSLILHIQSMHQSENKE